MNDYKQFDHQEQHSSEPVEEVTVAQITKAADKLLLNGKKAGESSIGFILITTSEHGNAFAIEGAHTIAGLHYAISNLVKAMNYIIGEPERFFIVDNEEIEKELSAIEMKLSPAFGKGGTA